MANRKAVLLFLGPLLAFSCCPFAGVPSGLERRPDPPMVAQTDARFVRADNGIVRDRKTGLHWYAGPDEATTWKEARVWVSSLAVDGGGWRMPSAAELGALFQKDTGERNMTPLLKTSGWWVWTGREKDGESAWYFDFRLGRADWTLHRFSYHSPRAFAVRTEKPLSEDGTQ